MPGLVVWINGAFGVGKTTTAEILATLRPSLKVFDPEQVGYKLRSTVPGNALDDFQDLPQWRALVAATAIELIAETNQSLVAPQTVLSKQYWLEIKQLLGESDLVVTHVLLDCERTVLMDRVRASDTATQWRLDHIGAYLAARDAWLAAAADVVVDVTMSSPDAVAHAIAEAVML